MLQYTSYCHDTNQKTTNVLILTDISKTSESEAVTAEGGIKTKEGEKKYIQILFKIHKKIT